MVAECRPDPRWSMIKLIFRISETDNYPLRDQRDWKTEEEAEQLPVDQDQLFGLGHWGGKLIISFWKVDLCHLIANTKVLGILVFFLPIHLTTKWMIWRFVLSLFQKYFFPFFFSRNIFLSHFIAIRGEGVVAPPLFYIIAAEKDKIKILKPACFKRDNQVNPI